LLDSLLQEMATNKITNRSSSRESEFESNSEISMMVDKGTENESDKMNSNRLEKNTDKSRLHINDENEVKEDELLEHKTGNETEKVVLVEHSEKLDTEETQLTEHNDINERYKIKLIESSDPTSLEKTPLSVLDVNSPDRPSRPTAPTPSKYGTLYGGAPSPGAPTSAFLPPGYVPPTPPAASKPTLDKSLNIRKKCLESVLSEETKEMFKNIKKTKLSSP